MKKSINESVVSTSIVFLSIMTSCTLCMIYKFSYIDLLYLIVVVICFILYLKNVMSQ